MENKNKNNPQKNIYSENCKTMMKETEDTNAKIYHDMNWKNTVRSILP